MKDQTENLNTKLSIICAGLNIFTFIGSAITYISEKNRVEDFKTLTFFWLMMFFICLIFSTVVLFKYITKLKIKIKSVNIIIEDIPITALNALNSIKTVNKEYKLDVAKNKIIIQGTDLIQEFESSGIKIRNIDNNNSYHYTIGSDHSVKLSEIDSYGYDLKHDPSRLQKIYPVLISQDGLSKKISIPFLENVTIESSFHAYFFSRINGCMNFGKDYYVSTTCMNEQRPLGLLQNTLIFKENKPTGVRLYEVLKNAKVKKLGALRKTSESENEVIFEDIHRNIESEKFLVYIFERSK